MKLLEILAHLSQIVLAIVACVSIVFAYFKFTEEFKEYKEDKKDQISIQASSEWDKALDQYSAPVISFIKKNNNPETLKKLRYANEIILCSKADKEKNTKCIEEHKRCTYGFLVNDKGIIPATKVNLLRISLVRYLNAWEEISRFYLDGKANKDILDKAFVNRLKRKGLYQTLFPYMELYSSTSWLSFRNLEKHVKAAAIKAKKYKEESAARVPCLTSE